VFFTDEEELMKFYKSPILDDILSKVNYLTEEATSAEVTAIVKKATHSGKITLLTRAFSRGTDFIILDEIVKSNGGTCTIQTFVSESASEEIQIKGRSARQG
jgi:preprotein translocase subunit SecA